MLDAKGKKFKKLTHSLQERRQQNQPPHLHSLWSGAPLLNNKSFALVGLAHFLLMCREQETFAIHQ